MENENGNNQKAHAIGEKAIEMMREFVKDKDLVLVTPKADTVKPEEISTIPQFRDLPNICELALGHFKLPTVEQMLNGIELPDGGFRPGELTIVSAKGRYPVNPLSAYRMLNLGMKDPNSYKLDEILSEELPKVKIMLEDCDRLYEKKPQAKED